MRLLVALADHFVATPDGVAFTGGPHRYTFWQRYLDVFEEVVVLCRCVGVDRPDPSWSPATGDRVSMIGLPDYTGPWEHLFVRGEMKRIIRQAVADADAILLRSGGDAVTTLTAKEARRRGQPFGVEVVSDPWDGLGPGTTKGLMRPIGRRIFTNNLKWQCRHAAAATYVTREHLQRRYPPSAHAFSTYYSDVEMPPQMVVPRPRTFDQPGSRLVFVGTLKQFKKAPDVLVRAVAKCVHRGLPLQLRFLGGGRAQQDLEEMARQLGIREQVIFLGQVAGREKVIEELDNADLFVLPSRQEGLPRAMLEAMARALPCVGSTRGGMPELLAPEDLVPAGDVGALADKLAEVLTDPQRLTAMSARNLKVTDEYPAELLLARRLEFYRRLRKLSGG